MKAGPGRPKGLKNQRTREIEAISRGMLEDPTYQASLRKRLRDGKAPHMETLLHHYAYGKPIERVRLAGEDGGPIQVSDPFMQILMRAWATDAEAESVTNGHHD